MCRAWIKSWVVEYCFQSSAGLGGSFVFWGDFWDCSVVGLEVSLDAFCKDVKA
ncbi:hypothetical protein [Bartonella grahamii]|uniref:hypothetical protein n=1 Tax=Bartonella grahamii TaxID=33045 RepID=UPI002E7B1748|nr:hypothetical protein [Bartonella grahamii]